MTPFISKILDSLVSLFNNPLISLASINFVQVLFSEIYEIPGENIPLNVLKVLYLSFESSDLVIRSIRAFNTGQNTMNQTMMKLDLNSFSQFGQILVNVLQNKMEYEFNSAKGYSLIPDYLLIKFFSHVLKFLSDLFALNNNPTLFKTLLEFCKKVFLQKSVSPAIKNLQVLMFNALLKFSKNMPEYLSDLLPMINLLKDAFIVEYLKCLLTLLNHNQYRTMALNSLQEFVEMSNFGNSDSALLEFFKEALGRNLNASSDLLDPFSEFLILHKENKLVQEWLCASCEIFCTGLVQNVSKVSLHPPLKYLTSILLNQESGIGLLR